MKTSSVIGLVILGVVIVLGLSLYGWVSGTYNTLVLERENVETSWATVETQYQRRFDLVPNLVNATKGALTQEQKVFGAIAEARTHYANAKQSGDVNAQVQATNQYESALARLMVVIENYPQLASLQIVRDLQAEITGTENRVQVARDRYNASVRTYNLVVQTFPNNLLAGPFGFEQAVFFQADEGASQAPVVDLSTD